jgi:hypothetical protein
MFKKILLAAASSANAGYGISIGYGQGYGYAPPLLQQLLLLYAVRPGLRLANLGSPSHAWADRGAAALPPEAAPLSLFLIPKL